MKLTAIQTQLFHERKQGSQESVDDFAEELRCLLPKAYGSRSQGTPEAESMGEIILANQLVAGLLPELKARVVGSERTLEQLLLKARFEKAKAKELRMLSRPLPTKKLSPDRPPSLVFSPKLQFNGKNPPGGQSSSRTDCNIRVSTAGWRGT